jgi:pyruvate/2-oxoglutarate dehydrogenase complex dihydrolipoamide dehydrogenase (E3) component
MADICVIGAGSGGLSVAAGAAQMGARTVLIERGAMGGDCLNVGCVPSKALIAAAKAAEAVRTADRFGIKAQAPVVDFAAVRAHVRDVIAGIAPHDGQARFEGLGVTVLRATARFAGRDTVTTDAGDTVRARRFVIATGSRPRIPAIPGLDRVPFLTNETLFDLDALPGHLIVMGGGPIGCEMAQAFRRLGARVTVLQRGTILPKDDPDLVAVVRGRMAADGVDLREGADVRAVEPAPGGVAVRAEGPDGPVSVVGTHLLVAIGRVPDLDALDLPAAGIQRKPDGVWVHRGLRTTNPRVYAIGDATGGPQFTHVAGHQAGIVLRQALFRLPAAFDAAGVPRVTYTAPELAQVGLTADEAAARSADFKVLVATFAENDRARTERETDGLVKVVVRPSGQILGAGIAGPQAGEAIHAWTIAIRSGLKIGTMAQYVAPYPTLGEAGKRAAGSFYTASLFGPRVKRLVRFLAGLPG